MTPAVIESPALVDVLLTYGYALMLDSAYGECREVLDRALRILTTHGGERSEDTIQVREHLGLLCYYEEKFPEAEAHFKTVHDILLEAGRDRDDDDDVRRSLENVATATCRTGPRTWE